MDVKIKNDKKTVSLDFKDDIIFTKGKASIIMENQYLDNNTPKLIIENATFVHINNKSKIKTLFKLIKYVYKK